MSGAGARRMAALVGLTLALAPGSARLDARASRVEGAGPLPVVQGRIFAPGDGTLPPTRLFVRRGAGTDSADVLPSGHFTLLLSAPLTDVTGVLVDAADPAHRRHHPSLVHVASPRELQNLRIVLVPRRWTIPTGRYAGTTVDIDAERALTPSRDGTRFWRLSRTGPSPAPVAVGWPADRVPVPVALQPARQSVSAADSAAFWEIVHDLERDLGMSLFRPERWQGADSAGAAGIVVRVDPALRSDGLTFVTWSADGDIYDGDVAVRSAPVLHDARVVTHEMLHALGLGHTQSWASVMSDGIRRATRATPADVAYGQVVHQVRWLQRTTGAPYGIAEAAEGARAAGTWRASRVAIGP